MKKQQKQQQQQYYIPHTRNIQSRFWGDNDHQPGNTNHRQVPKQQQQQRNDCNNSRAATTTTTANVWSLTIWSGVWWIFLVDVLLLFEVFNCYFCFAVLAIFGVWFFWIATKNSSVHAKKTTTICLFLDEKMFKQISSLFTWFFFFHRKEYLKTTWFKGNGEWFIVPYIVETHVSYGFYG